MLKQWRLKKGNKYNTIGQNKNFLISYKTKVIYNCRYNLFQESYYYRYKSMWLKENK